MLLDFNFPQQFTSNITPLVGQTKQNIFVDKRTPHSRSSTVNTKHSLCFCIRFGAVPSILCDTFVQNKWKQVLENIEKCQFYAIIYETKKQRNRVRERDEGRKGERIA